MFVLPTYSVGQVENARRTAKLAADDGFAPVIVCNSASAAAALADHPSARSTGANTGYGGAATLVAESVEFEIMVLCNDDLHFTDAAMQALRVAIERLESDEPIIMGFLPRDRPRITPLPAARGVVALVSGLAGMTRRYGERLARRSYTVDPSLCGPQQLPDGLGFPFVCVAITREAWELLGGFDGRFPLYFEDVDLLTRAHRSGAVQVSVALGDCSHLHSASARTVLPYILPLMSVGARNYLQLHRRLPRPIAALLVTTGLLVRAMCWLPVRPDRRTEGRAILRALGAAWSTRPVPMPPWS
ncbi:MAG: hypothetical protein M3378_01225 [Actinomycetota bacterium]|nr:hypothetical protein [Actinomycetota bacterium]